MRSMYGDIRLVSVTTDKVIRYASVLFRSCVFLIPFVQNLYVICPVSCKNLMMSGDSMSPPDY